MEFKGMQRKTDSNESATGQDCYTVSGTNDTNDLGGRIACYMSRMKFP